MTDCRLKTKQILSSRVLLRVARRVPLDVKCGYCVLAAISSYLTDLSFNIRKAVPMADGPKTKFSRRGFLKGAGVTAATTVIESANALARETKDLA